jgi:hypothetical protein
MAGLARLRRLTIGAQDTILPHGPVARQVLCFP